MQRGAAARMASALAVGAVAMARAAAGQCQLLQVAASDAAAGHTFGLPVALSGDAGRALIGAFQHSGAGHQSGAAYIFRRGGVHWVEETMLQASRPAAGDRFGRAVAMAGGGTAAVIGAPGEGPDDANGFGAGAAYIVERRGAVWTEAARLMAPDSAAGDEFGMAVAISAAGDIAVVAAWLDDLAAAGTGGAGTRGGGDAGGVIADAGSIHVFTRSQGTWSHAAKLVAADAGSGDWLGASVAISSAGDVILAGAPSDDQEGAPSAGAAYAFTRSPEGSGPAGEWMSSVKITAPDAAGSDWFGGAVAISGSGDRALIGARLDDDGAEQAGSAYIFNRNGTTWTMARKLVAPDPDPQDEFGGDVALAPGGDTAVVGAALDDEHGLDSGAAYVYIDGGISWPHLMKLHPQRSGGGGASPARAAAGDEFGRAVTTAGGMALIGAWVNGEAAPAAGAAYFFAVSGPDCNGTAAIDACDIALGDSRDGNANAIPDECEDPVIPGDADGDGAVGQLDLIILLNAWGPCRPEPALCPADFDGDGDVDVNDLLALLGNWG